MHERDDAGREFWFFMGAMGLIWCYRLFHLLHLDYDLYLDEAYYYNWAKHLDWGYYSKPPVLSWLIRLSTEIFGPSVFGIKAGALFVYPLTTWFVYLIARELYDKRSALWAALIFFTLPSVWVSSLIISTDVVLLLFWAMGLFFFIKALKTQKLLYWIASGVAGGLGLLSKYNFIFFLAAALLYLIIVPAYRRYLKSAELYIAMGIAFMIFLPNLWWNYQHDFISFVHTKEISQVNKALFHPGKFLEFFAAQFLVFGPILFGAYWVALSKKRTYEDKRGILLVLFSFLPLGFILLLSLLSRSFANWAAPAYIGATILVTRFLLRRGKVSLLKLSVVLHTLLAILFYEYHPITRALGIELTRKSDPYKRMMGWRKIAREIEKVWQCCPEATLLADGRAEAAQFDYYLHTTTYLYNPQNRIRNQYHMTRDLQKLVGEDFIYVTKRLLPERMRREFEKIEDLGEVTVPLYRDYNRSYHLYHLRNFKGYR